MRIYVFGGPEKLRVKLISVTIVRSMNPVISVIIVNYNYGRFLEDAIRSIVSQDGFSKCELIVVDGGSTDESAEIIRKYSGQIAWWVSEKDKGQSDAFNKGFAHARGRIGCWVNADDILLPGTLRSVLECLDKRPKTEWITGGMAFCDDKLRVRQLRIGSSLPPLVNPMTLSMTVIGGPSSFFPIERMKRIGGFDLSLRYTMDNDLWMRLFKDGARFTHINRCFWAFRLHEDSKTSPALISSSGACAGHCKERKRLLIKSGASYGQIVLGKWILRLWKLVNGSFVRSWLGTLRYSGSSIYDMR